MEWGEKDEVATDVLVVGGGIAGCWAAISAAKAGAQVVLVEKAATGGGHRALCRAVGGRVCPNCPGSHRRSAASRRRI